MTWSTLGSCWVFTVLSPITAVQTSYSSLWSDIKTIAYSLPGAKKIGSGNLTFVATSPVVEVLMSSISSPLIGSTDLGLRVTGFPMTSSVGVPNSVDLTSTLSGALPLSIFAKYKSTDVKNAPFTSSSVSISDLTWIFPPTVNVCANGSA